MPVLRRLLVAITLLLVLAVVPGLSELGLSVPSSAGQMVESDPAPPYWSSGWVDIAPGATITFTHGLGGEPALYAVNVWFRDTRLPGLGIHHRGYGGMDVAGQQYGAYWHNLTGSTISVTRRPDDVRAAQVRVLIFVPKQRDFDSGWQEVAPGQVVTLTHDLGGDVDDYTAGVEFYDSAPNGLGIHQFAAGGMEHEGAWEGAALQKLTASTVQLIRFPDDVHASRARMVINRAVSPTYDSGWQSVAPGETFTLTHNLGGNPNFYIARVLARSAAAGINERAGGGMEFGGRYIGSNSENLTARQVTFYRQPDDVYAEQVRVRIWQVGPRPPSPNLVVVSPPPGLGVPVGQYIGVCYYFEGESPAVLEFVPEGGEPVREWVRPGQAVTHAWMPAEPGPHELRVRVLAPDGSVQASSSLAVTGLPASSRVHVPQLFFPVRGLRGSRGEQSGACQVSRWNVQTF